MTALPEWTVNNRLFLAFASLEVKYLGSLAFNPRGSGAVLDGHLAKRFVGAPRLDGPAFLIRGFNTLSYFVFRLRLQARLDDQAALFKTGEVENRLVSVQ